MVYGLNIKLIFCKKMNSYILKKEKTECRRLLLPKTFIYIMAKKKR
jgi:hypothetical protein